MQHRNRSNVVWSEEGTASSGKIDNTKKVFYFFWEFYVGWLITAALGPVPRSQKHLSHFVNYIGGRIIVCIEFLVHIVMCSWKGNIWFSVIQWHTLNRMCCTCSHAPFLFCSIQRGSQLWTFHGNYCMYFRCCAVHKWCIRTWMDIANLVISMGLCCPC